VENGWLQQPVSTTVRRAWIPKFGVILALTLIVLLGWRIFSEPDFDRIQVATLEELEREMERLRARLRIPGMSAAIAEHQRVVWTRGFGMADLERGIPAREDTIYHLASLTKPYASTVVLQLAEEGRLDLNAPVSRFGIAIERSTPVKVWHLLSHTSDEPPGTRYRYDGNAFGRLTQVIERAAGQPFARELANRIIRPLGLTHTGPNPSDPQGFWSLFASLDVSGEDVARARSEFAASGVERQPIQAALAQGYARSWGRWIWPTGLFGPMRPIPHGFTLSATSGLAASAPDVMRFSMALDQGRLLSDAMRARAWTPPMASDGRPLRYALGWFVQKHREYDLVWHYGHGLESSSLIVKIPKRQVTFVILANSDGLSRWRSLGDNAEVSGSPAAALFLNWYSSRTPR
jgi:CubicO group peptidase (beta-lactamase class C family)